MIAGVVLAAGTSSRLGRPKQLLPLQGKPLTQHVIDATIAAGLDEVVVVLGHAAEEVEAGLELPPPARAVVNPDYEAGQSSSRCPFGSLSLWSLPFDRRWTTSRPGGPSGSSLLDS